MFDQRQKFQWVTSPWTSDCSAGTMFQMIICAHRSLLYTHPSNIKSARWDKESMLTEINWIAKKDGH